MIALLIIGGLATLVAYIWGSEAIETRGKNAGWYTFLFLIGTVLFAAGLLLAGDEAGKEGHYNEGQIDALKGIQTHEIQYVFPQGDTIPCDTLYVKIK